MQDVEDEATTGSSNDEGTKTLSADSHPLMLQDGDVGSVRPMLIDGEAPSDTEHEDRHGHPAGGSASVRPAAPMPSSLAPPPAKRPRPDAAGRGTGTFVMPKKWGCFTISYKGPEQHGGRFGGMQASCPFHARNRRTGCKKWFGFKEDSDTHKWRMLDELKYWCVQARDHDLQWNHIYFSDELGNVTCPEELDLETLRIDEGPSEPPITDEDFYGSALGRLPGAKAKAKGRPRGKAAAGAPGEAKAKPKPRSKAARRRPMGQPAALVAAALPAAGVDAAPDVIQDVVPDAAAMADEVENGVGRV